MNLLFLLFICLLICGLSEKNKKEKPNNSQKYKKRIPNRSKNSNYEKKNNNIENKKVVKKDPLIINKEKYDYSDYKKESGNPYLKVISDKGLQGEYLTFDILNKIEGQHRICANAYLPKENGETTEVDLILIHETGIYVIESKNYSGWIFGYEDSVNWMEIFPNGHKQQFYNPIWQNNTHVTYLTKSLQIDRRYVKSIIVFNDICTIKKMNVSSQNIAVITRDQLKELIERCSYDTPTVFSNDEIIQIYRKLKKYTLVSKEVKQRHIEYVEAKKNHMSKQENNNSNTQKKYNNSFEQNKNSLNFEFYKELKEYRLNKSKEENIKAYAIFSDLNMDDIIRLKPITIDDLKLIYGFGNSKCNKYGQDIINIVKKHYFNK